MSLGSVLVSTLFTIGKALFTEKVLVNLTALLAEWAAKKTSNDLDDRIVQELKRGIDESRGRPVNLYQEVKSKAK
jgi:hypothetical protein